MQEGYDTARQVGLIMLAKVRAALGSLDHVKRIVKVLGMVNSAEGFGEQPKVINGFSDLMVDVYGEAGSLNAHRDPNLAQRARAAEKFMSAGGRRFWRTARYKERAPSEERKRDN